MEKIITISRRQLYLEVWSYGVSRVSNKYNLNYTKFIEALKENNIPYPNSGYWTKINLKKDVRDDFKSLPYSDKNDVTLVLKKDVIKKQDIIQIQDDRKMSKKELNTLVDRYCEKYLLDYDINQRKHIIKTIIEYTSRNNKYCEKIKEYINEDRAYRKHLKTRRNSGLYYYNGNYPKLYGKYSEQAECRVLTILNTIHLVFDSLGAEVNSINEFIIDGETIVINIREKQNKVLHVGDTRRTFATYDYDYVYSGILIIRIGAGKWYCDEEFSDTKTTKLEDKIIDILFYIYEFVMERKIIEEKRRKEDEERRKRYEEACRRKRLYENEMKKVGQLVKEANDYKTAILIREYLKSKKKYDAEWLIWAYMIADWYDPNVRYVDGILGKRGEEKKTVYDY